MIGPRRLPQTASAFPGRRASPTSPQTSQSVAPTAVGRPDSVRSLIVMPEMLQKVGSLSSHATAVPPSATDHEPAARLESDPRAPQSIPPWVHMGCDEADAFLPKPSVPDHTVPNSRHYRPPPANYKPGRKWDHVRSASPPYVRETLPEQQARWQPIMASSPNPKEQSAHARIMDDRWMEANMAAVIGLGWREEDDWAADGTHQSPAPVGFQGLMYHGKWLISPERQERTVRLFWRLLLKNPFVPLAFRLCVLIFSAASVGIAAGMQEAIKHANSDANSTNNCAARASTYMAICVGTVAIPYLGYVTWDEYMSKPLGLRSVAAKTLLLLCDLYFVVFAASNLSLAFDSLYDHGWACYADFDGKDKVSIPSSCPSNHHICSQQKALSAILFISLGAWLLTFSVSVMRVVEKLRPDP
ncbi:hypothetical protein K470DRAFT_256693 [Piedraia hortae CBS 480.64]|uniref:Uncharacterized protein n=1 Tax=Piedraia hortae CBS 480.64 TaxID=1314780 RepID=A0A6A7C3F8_9PEZI|nr:hypothetical protein K470DRAFT_256693 [Piedraia hortae CBS 480.64]